MIDQTQYEFFYKLGRDERQYALGIMQRDNININKGLKEGFKETMKLFFEANQLEDSDILAIKKDAVYIINKIPTATRFGNIEFVNKNVYTSFYKVKKMELYYYGNNAINLECLHVKGINDKTLRLQNGYFLEFLLVVFNSAQTDPIEETIGIIQEFYNRYVSLELDVGYYREFNSLSEFSIKRNSRISQYKADYIEEKHKSILDISCNGTVIVELYKIFSSIYFQQKNKR